VSASGVLELQEKQLELRSERSNFFRRPEFWMVLAGFAIRMAVMPFLIGEQLAPERDHWSFGYEAGRIARSIVQGRGFGSPLFSDTGPTAWMTPVYPYIVAGFFKVFGLYTAASAVALLTFNALVSAFTSIPIFLIAKRTFGDRTARWAGWSWVVFPYAIYFPMERLWETWLATLLLSCIFLLGLKLQDEPSGLRGWIGFGALWGLAALTSPTILSILPFLGAWICHRLRREGRSWLAPSAATLLTLTLVVSPWFVRNYVVFHKFIPFRDNMGMVLRLGTKGNSNHWAQYGLGPWHNDNEWQQFQKLGELGYMAKEKRQAFQFIAQHPVWYGWTSFRRMIFLWSGYWSFDRGYLHQEPLDPPNIFFSCSCTVLALLGLWRAFRQGFDCAMPYALVLLTFPAIYYITSPEAYYRRPIDPLLVILIAYVLSTKKQRRERHRNKWIEEREMEELLVT
jgi:4-amino-4-deoxy-L-arabinose transferase-like glycosyltransferase